MQVSDSTPSPADFLQVPGPYGHPVLIHRLQAEQSAASGMPVLIAIPVDAVRLALAGKSCDPRERFSELDRLIADVLDEIGHGTAKRIAYLIEHDHDGIADAGSVRARFLKDLPLRAAGYTSRHGVGYSAPEQS